MVSPNRLSGQGSKLSHQVRTESELLMIENADPEEEEDEESLD